MCLLPWDRYIVDKNEGRESTGFDQERMKLWPLSRGLAADLFCLFFPVSRLISSFMLRNKRRFTFIELTWLSGVGWVFCLWLLFVLAWWSRINGTKSIINRKNSSSTCICCLKYYILFVIIHAVSLQSGINWRHLMLCLNPSSRVCSSVYRKHIKSDKCGRL